MEWIQVSGSLYRTTSRGQCQFRSPIDQFQPIDKCADQPADDEGYGRSSGVGGSRVSHVVPALLLQPVGVSAIRGFLYAGGRQRQGAWLETHRRKPKSAVG